MHQPFQFTGIRMGNTLASGRAVKMEKSKRPREFHPSGPFGPQVLYEEAEGLEPCLSRPGPFSTRKGLIPINEVFGVGRLTRPKPDSVRLEVDVNQLIQQGPSGDSAAYTKYYSPTFTLPEKGPEWRLLLAPQDFNEDNVSVYLEHVPSVESAPQEARCTFSLQLDCLPPGAAGPEGRGRRSGSPGPVHPLTHTFCPEEPNWGVQDLLSLRDVSDAAHSDGGSSILGLTVHVSSIRTIPWNHVPITGGTPLRRAPPYSIELVSEHPRIFLMEDFLEPELCDRIIQLAKPEVQRSRVSSGSETPSRTSSGTFLTGRKELEPCVLELESRIDALLRDPVVRWGGRKALYEVEALQVVRYEETQRYEAHYDTRSGCVHLRAATFMVYLSDCKAGGATYFPRSTGPPSRDKAEDDALVGSMQRLSVGIEGDRQRAGSEDSGRPPSGAAPAPAAVTTSRKPEAGLGLGGKASYPGQGFRVFPKKGRAILFWSRMSDGSEDVAAIHAGEEVVSGPEKWICTRWLREHETPTTVTA